MEDGDQDGDAPDSDEERDTQRVQRIKAAHADAGEGAAADEDMPSAKVSHRNLSLPMQTITSIRLAHHLDTDLFAPIQQMHVLAGILRTHMCTLC